MNENMTLNTNKLYFTKALKEALPAIFEKPITIIEAPMGYGKTVAVREFLKDKPADVLWIPLSSCLKGDYWDLFCRTLEERYPHEAQIAGKLRVLGFPKEEEDIYKILEILDQFQFDRPAVLVLDDYHLINHQRMSRLVEAMVNRGCVNFHGVLITRDIYCGNSEILSLKGLLKIIGRHHFIFSQEDIKSYYELCGVTLSEEEITALYQATEGWVSALYLYLLRYEKEGVIAFPTNMYELIDLEMFSRLSENEKDFLFSVCPFGDFNFQQADFVWEKGNPHHLLSSLRSKNAFVTYDDLAQRFFIHSILLNFIERNINRMPDEKWKKLYVRCGDWFLKEQDYYQAVIYYYQAEDFDRIMTALESDRGNSIAISRWPFYSKIIKECPPEVLYGHIRAAFILTVSAFLLRDTESYEWMWNFIENLLLAIPKDSPEKANAEGILEFFLAFQSYNDIEAMEKHCKKCRDLLNSQLDVFSTKVPNWTMGSPSVLFMFHRNSGSLIKEVNQMKEYIFTYSSIVKGHGMGSAEIMEAEMYLNRGQLEKAEVAAFAAETIAEKHNQTSIIFCAKFLQLRCALIRGNRTELERLLNSMKIIENHDSYIDGFLQHQLDISKGFLYTLLGEYQSFPSWIKKTENLQFRLYQFAYPAFYIVHGRYLLSEKSYSKIIGLYRTLIHEPLFYNHTMFLIYANIYITAAQFALGWQSQALHTLKEALELAVPDKVYLPFAENYESIKPLFEFLPDTEADKENWSEIKSLAGLLENGICLLTSKGGKNGGKILSRREQELARLACTDKSYSEIAEELFLAKSTVKRAMVAIFRKLDIHNRQELIDHKDKFQ